MSREFVVLAGLQLGQQPAQNGSGVGAANPLYFCVAANSLGKGSLNQGLPLPIWVQVWLIAFLPHRATSGQMDGVLKANRFKCNGGETLEMRSAASRFRLAR